MSDALSAEQLRRKISAICLSLPEAQTAPRLSAHSKFSVAGRTFAYYLVDHHGDGRLALACKAAPGAQAGLVAADPTRFFIPPYLGAKGWIGYDFGAARADWREVRELITGSYCLVAPRRLAAAIGASAPE